ncbi:MAG: Smr/MutS family protein [Oligoflexales bacterium]|nr:Smr/MutS family protein [Oligoflexales bacterium]
MNQDSIYNKLDWNLLIEKLANLCQTQEGLENTKQYTPNLEREQILARWALVSPLKELFAQCYLAPIGELRPIRSFVKSAEVGQILEGTDLRELLDLLQAVARVHQFANDFAPRCSTLASFKSALQPLHAIQKSIEKAIDKDGKLLDTASNELASIRKQKSNLGRRIEQKLKSLLHDQSWELYIQDDFYTIRAERYVIPIKLDGRGRVSGNIIDTSDSGQTLYIEPLAIATLNQSRQDLELSEKLEMLRILKSLTQSVAVNAEVFISNYEQLILLDQLTAEARLAFDLGAKPIHLSSSAKVNLIKARHPLITGPQGHPPVPNHIELSQEQSALIISGPNAGGKTVVLKTLGMILLMAKTGLLIPAEEESELFLFENLYIEMGDSQSLTANLSTFSGHIQGLMPIINQAGPCDLVLLDELAVGTEPATGAAIAQAIIERLVDRKTTLLVTTHYDNLKGLALKNKKFRNASMEYSLSNFKPTYKLILDIPGQSYGLELAQQIGVPKEVIERSTELRGSSVSDLDEAITQLMKAREDTQKTKEKYDLAMDEADAAKARWNHEVKLIEETRQNAAKSLKVKYDKELASIRDRFESTSKDMKLELKQLRSGAPSSGVDKQVDELAAQKKRAKAEIETYQRTIGDLNQHQKTLKLPGKVVAFDELNIGDQVFIVPLGQQGRVVKINPNQNEKVEVEAGLLSLKAEFKDLRKISGKKPSSSKNPTQKSHLKKKRAQAQGSSKEPELIFQTSTNTIDLRGCMLDDALEKVWRFIDAAVLRGEKQVILVHGHGTDSLKQGIRNALNQDGPYDLKHQAGDRYCGGDGVTVVYFED